MSTSRSANLARRTVISSTSFKALSSLRVNLLIWKATYMVTVDERNPQRFLGLAISAG